MTKLLEALATFPIDMYTVQQHFHKHEHCVQRLHHADGRRWQEEEMAVKEQVTWQEEEMAIKKQSHDSGKNEST